MKHVLTIAISLLMACSGAEETPPDTSPNNNPNNDSNANNVSNSNNSASNNVTTNNANNSNNSSAVNRIPPGSVVINEVVAAGSPDWVELLNVSDEAVDLGDAFITDTISEATKGMLPSGLSIGPGEYLLVEIDDTSVGFKLGGDEEFALYGQDGETLIDSVDWDEGDSPSGGAFGRVPDGTGEFQTLDFQTPEAPNVEPSSCGDGRISGDEVCDGTDLMGEDCEGLGFVGGELACATDCKSLDTSACEMPTSAVFINEVTSSGDDQIELYNQGNVGADISGWYIGDDGFDPNDIAGTEDKRFVFAAGTSIDAGGYLVLVKNTDHMFGIGSVDALTLYDDSGTVVDSVIWEAGQAATSYCRMPDGGAFQECAAQSFGSTNSQ